METSSRFDRQEQRGGHNLRSFLSWKFLLRLVGSSQGPHTEDYEQVPMREDVDSSTNLPALPSSNSKTCRWTRRLVIGVVCLLALIVFSFGTLHVAIVLLGHANFFGIVPDSQGFPEGGYPDYDSKPYPQHATQDVVPIPCHSHNDYQRKVPLFDAIHAGCTSVEADIWLIPESAELYVGHKKNSLSEGRTLRSLYLDPIYDLLTSANVGDVTRNFTTRGIFETKPEQALVLLLDFKTDGHLLLPHVQKHLEPLRKKNYLSFWNGLQFVSQQITIVATGNAPYDLGTQDTGHHDIFRDAPLEEFWDSPKEPASTTLDISSGARTRETADSSLPYWNVSTAFYASTSFSATIGQPRMGRLTSRQLKTIRGQIRGAHERGLKVRYWDTPAWPISLRNYIWRVLLDEGSDVLNVDDIRAAAFLDWNRVFHSWVNG